MTATTTPSVAPMTRGRIAVLIGVGIMSVSVASVLAAIIIGDSGDPRLGISIAAWRTVGGAAALAPFALRARRSHPLSALDRRRLVAAGIFLALHFALFLGSIAYTSVASAATLATMAGIFVAIGGIWYVDERPTVRAWAGIALTVVGAAVIGLGDVSNLDLGGTALLGDTMSFVSAMLVAGYLLIARKVRSRVHATTFSSIVYASAAALLVPAALLLGAPLVGFSSEQWLALAGMVVFPQLLGHNIFTTLLSSVPASVVGMIVLVEPVIATLLAWGLLAQTPLASYWIGAPVVLVGLLVATLGRTAVAATT